MSTTSKSLKRNLQAAYEPAKQRLSKFSYQFSPKKFTHSQSLAYLLLKEFLRLDCRKLSTLLEDIPKLAARIELKKISYFQYLGIDGSPLAVFATLSEASGQNRLSD
ncbi:hypothetical protein [Bythopirellula goksoeyrii]|nr:hypothetical protein [Bythopirellula goksoeyrii]